ncbi:ABC transporter substrate-binding protein [Bacillaceae bacterium IKA-2]|nr:ABC transporter substrate-binding protein [Bacillaceae bacterium IKA-2]
MNKFIIGISGLITFIAIVIVLILSLEDLEKSSYKIGVLMTGENRLIKLDGMESGLEKLGYQLDSIEFIVEDAGDDVSKLDELAQDLLKKKPDLIVSLGGIETQVLEKNMKKIQTFIPTVFVGIAGPYELGLIKEYKSPGSYFTGVNNFHMNLSSKRLEMFTELVPNMERVYVIYSGGVDISEMSLDIVHEAALKMNVDIIEVDLNRTGALKQLEAKLINRDGILTLPSYQVELVAEEISALALRKNVPTMGIYEYEVEAGYLFSYGSMFFDQGYQAARHVSLILQGNEASDLPVELPDSIRFIINEEVRKTLAIDVNQDISKLAEKYERGSER